MKRNLKVLISAITMVAMTLTTSIPVLANTNSNAEEVQAVPQNTKRSIGYYGDWSIYGGQDLCFPERIPAEYLTHLNVAFTGCNKDGTLLMLDKDANFGHPLGHGDVSYGDINGGIVNELQSVRKQYPNLKLGFSIGGWSLSGNFTWVARDAAKRKIFAKEIAELIEYANFDFIDIDWEYPGEIRQADNVDLKNDQGNPDAIPEDKENYVLMLQEIRNELNELSKKTNKKYEISIAINMSHAKTELGIDIPKIFNIIDFANVMTYDGAGAWEGISGHQTPLYDNPNSPHAGQGFSVDSSIQYFLEKGAPANKLVVGAAYYTRGWEKVSNENVPDPNLPGLYGTATKVNRDADLEYGFGAKNYAPTIMGDGGRNAGSWPWRKMDELKQAYPGLVEYWDDTAKAPYLYNKDTGAFFTYDNKKSIAEKCKYVNENNLGGIITWMVSNDAITESGKNDDLTKAIYQGLFGDTKLPQYDIIDPALDVSAEINAYTEEWGALKGTLSISITNNAKLTSTSSIMPKTAEEACKTIKYPKIYIKTNGITVSGGEYPSTQVKQENGYYVIDLGTISSVKLIAPGRTETMKVKLSKELTNLDGIEEIFMTQRVHATANEMSKTYLYQAGPHVYEKEDVNKDDAVDINDLSLVALKYNKKSTDAGYDAACDINSDKIIDLYDLVLVAKKIGGSSDKPVVDPDNTWDATVRYKQGETVVYKGITYKAKWETIGETPDNQWSAWEKVSN